MTVLGFLRKVEQDIADLFNRQNEIEPKLLDAVAKKVSAHRDESSERMAALERQVSDLLSRFGDQAEGPQALGGSAAPTEAPVDPSFVLAGALNPSPDATQADSVSSATADPAAGPDTLQPVAA